MFHLVYLQLLSDNTDFALNLVILDLLSVRIHSALVFKKPWVRLWYLSRAFDWAGRGCVILPVRFLCQVLHVSLRRLYQWLKIGKCCGAFRKYYRVHGCFCIWLGSLSKVCQALGLRNWGAVATVPLFDILTRAGLKAAAAGIQAQQLQHKSYVAAKLSLPSKERKFHRLSEVDQILGWGKESSQNPVGGQVPFLLHVGPSKAFVSKGFIPFGGSQETIAEYLGVSSRTVRRHLIGVDRRQIVQAKAAYRKIEQAMRWDADFYRADSSIWVECVKNAPWGTYALHEPNGASSASRPGGTEVTSDRFFEYMDKTWIYRCNLYDLDYNLNSMQRSRRNFIREAYRSQTSEPALSSGLV